MKLKITPTINLKKICSQLFDVILYDQRILVCQHEWIPHDYLLLNWPLAVITALTQGLAIRKGNKPAYSYTCLKSEH